MLKTVAAGVLVMANMAASAPARADPYICVGGMTEVEVLFHVRHDAYFTRNPLRGRSLRAEYDGCGYRVHVGQSSPMANDGDVLWVDRYGHVTRVLQRS